MRKLTPWFEAGEPPARRGVYEVEPSSWTDWLNAYQYWDGKEWHFRRPTVEEAFECRKYFTTHHSPKWRGLAEKP